ncbi:MAG: IS66 family insertion sequence element accessory protein TnpB [Rikenellaceae bacterium]
MVLNIEENVRFYCYNEGVDMRKGIHSLYGIIRTECEVSALDGDAFVFIGTNLKSVKILRWHREGFLLYHKKLELGRYNIPQVCCNESFFELKRDQINKLIASVKHRSAVNELKQKIMLTL